PGDHAAFFRNGEIVAGSCGDGNKTEGAGGHGCLSVAVVSPADKRSVVMEGNTVIIAACDGDDVIETRRDIGLAAGIIAPGNHGRRNRHDAYTSAARNASG